MTFRREVSYEEGEQFAKKNNMIFYETSAKSGKNIEEMFLVSVKDVNEKIKSNYYDLSTDVSS